MLFLKSSNSNTCRQREANDVIFNNDIAMKLIEQTYTSSGGAPHRAPAATNFPPTNTLYLNPPNAYDHPDTYTCVDAGQTAFLPQPPYPPPQYVPSTLQSDNGTNEPFYVEIPGECIKESYQPQEKNVFAAETKHQSPPSNQEEESNASK